MPLRPLEKNILEFLNSINKKRISFLDVLYYFDEYKVSEIEGAINALHLIGAATIRTKDLRPYEVVIHNYHNTDID